MLHWHNIKYDLSRKWENVIMYLVWKLPRKIVYWSAIRVATHATTGEYKYQVVSELTLVEALQRWWDDNE